MHSKITLRNENFKVSYNVLSDGGKGELYLENPEDPFKAGLELWAKPKGKSSKVSRLQLSGGEQQRVAFCRAVANEPKILLADEPTGNLDEKTSDTVFNALLSLVESSRMAALIATHNENLVKKMNRHIKLKSGKLFSS